MPLSYGVVPTHQATHVSGGSDALASRIAVAAIPYQMFNATITYYIDNTGTDIFFANDTLRSTTSDTYVKLKEITLTKTPDTTLKTRFWLEPQTGYTAYGRVYKNGVAVGTERSTASAVDFTESIAGWADGDKYQIYGHSNVAGYTCSISEQRILGTIVSSPAQASTSGY